MLMPDSWPGNARELENLVERITILKETAQAALLELDLSHTRQNGIIPDVDIPNDGLDFDNVVQAFERQLLRRPAGCRLSFYK